MKRILSIVLSIIISLSVLPISVFADAGTIGTPVDGEITFPFSVSHYFGSEKDAGENGIGTETVLFRDCWFKSSSYTYNHELAIASMAGAISTATYDTTGTGIVENGDWMIRSFLYAIGCDMDRVFTHKLDNCREYVDECAFAFAIKSIPGTDDYLIPVFVRGHGCGGEWISNVNVYDKKDPVHSIGFRDAAKYVYGYLETYISNLEKEGISKDHMKLWIAGYSRGAAVANNIGDMVNSSEMFNPEYTFVYTFATPNTVLQSSAIEYENIFNICDEQDIVIRVPLVEWGYTRYGKTFYLPCRTISGDAYDERIANMQAEFSKIMAGINMPDFQNIPFDKQEVIIDLLLSFLTDAVSSAEDYGVNMWQENLRTLLKTLITYDTDLQNFFAFLSNANSLLGQIVPEKMINIVNQCTELLYMIAEIAICYAICFAAEKLTDGKIDNVRDYNDMFAMIKDIIENGQDSILLMQHWPETYLAWMRSGTAEELLTENSHDIKWSKIPCIIK